MSSTPSLAFESTDDLAQALIRAGTAHGEYEERLGQGRDANWPRWYAQYIEQERAGGEPGSSSASVTFDSADELAEALLRAERAHADHQEQTGREEPDWPAWYARYFEREQAGDGGAV
jgi:hypothetical protein